VNSEQGTAQEKSYEPTPQRLERARREGDAPQSREVNAAAAYVGFYLALLFAAGAGAATFAAALRRMHDDPAIFSTLAFAAGREFMSELASALALPLLPLFLLPMSAVILALVAQGAVAPSLRKLPPDFGRLSLLKNARTKFGPTGLADFIKAFAKLAAIAALFGLFGAGRLVSLPATALLPPQAAPRLILEHALLFIGLIALFSAALAAIDAPLVRARRRKKLMMSLAELRQETKESEGDPHVKQSRRDRSRTIATNRMLREVTRASVVIVNPSHYAVALSWSRASKKAPVVVAKGVDEIAARIREIASARGVPIRRDAPTARALYAAVAVGAEIERAHFAAVAAAIHFAEEMRRKARER
jgi:flagellar biosynthetic protein FlhB